MSGLIPVLINRAAGMAAAMGEELDEFIEQAFASIGYSIALELVEESEFADAVKRKIGAPVLVIGGGDGTISSAAAVLAGSPTALAILPLGSRNYIARELGVPLDLDEAAELAVTGQRRRMDLGSAGECVFINSACFGIYARFLRERQIASSPRSFGSPRAIWHALRHMRSQHFWLRLNGQAVPMATPLLVVGNKGSPDPSQAADNEPLCDGALSLWGVAARQPHQLLGFAMRALFGFARPERELQELGAAQEITIEGEGAIEGALDGELHLLRLPLKLSCMPAALGVVTPREPAQAERALSRIH